MKALTLFLFILGVTNCRLHGYLFKITEGRPTNRV